MQQKLSTVQVLEKLNKTDFSCFPKPGKNKGERGTLIENALGISKSSSLKDMIDGELKTFTTGQSIAVTSLYHCLDEIIRYSLEFEESRVYDKIKQTIFVSFSRDNDYKNTFLVNEESYEQLYLQMAEDYGYVSSVIKKTYLERKKLHTTTGPNKLLQIRTKAAKINGKYVPLCYEGVELKDKYMAFYLTANFTRKLI